MSEITGERIQELRVFIEGRIKNEIPQNVREDLDLALSALLQAWREIEELKKGPVEIRNPEWPNGITLAEYLGSRSYLWITPSGCRWCGRKTDKPNKGHDGFCPIPFMWAANEALLPEKKGGGE